MKSKHGFIVRIPKKFKDSVSVAGIELYIDPKFREFENRVCSADIVETPLGYTGPAGIGDTLHFHHHVVLNEKLALGDDLYIVLYDKNGGYGSHAYAYTRGGETFMLDEWIFLHARDESGLKEKNGLFLMADKEDHGNEGVIAFLPESAEHYGLSVGQTVGFSKNSDYEIEVNGKMYWRMLLNDIMYRRDS